MKKLVVAMVLALAFGGVARAAILKTDVGVSVKTDDEVNVGTGAVSGSASEDASVKAGADGTVKQEDRSEGKPAESEGRSRQNENEDASGSVSAGSDVSLSAGEINGWDDKTKSEFLSTVKSHAELQSGADLKNFAKGVIASDDNVDAVSSNDSDVAVSYKLPAKFLGIFGASLGTTVDVSFKGKTSNEPQSVTVKFPWYRIFYSLDSKVQSDAIQNAVSSQVAAQASSSANVFVRNGTTIEIVSSLLKAIRAEL